MSSNEPLNLKSEEDTQPVPRLVAMLISAAIDDKADCIQFELNDELKEFHIVFRIGNTATELSPPPAHLFDPVIRALLTHTEIPYWTKGDVLAEIKTVHPTSKWIVESKDLKQLVQMRRIHTLKPPSL